jgi:hypothetical protein
MQHILTVKCLQTFWRTYFPYYKNIHLKLQSELDIETIIRVITARQQKYECKHSINIMTSFGVEIWNLSITNIFHLNSDLEIYFMIKVGEIFIRIHSQMTSMKKCEF